MLLPGERQRQRFWLEQLLQSALLQLQWLRPYGRKLQQAQKGCLRGRFAFSACKLLWAPQCCCQDLWAASYEPSIASGDKEVQDNGCLVHNGSRADLISALKNRLKRDMPTTNDVATRLPGQSWLQSLTPPHTTSRHACSCLLLAGLLPLSSKSGRIVSPPYCVFGL